MRFTDGPVVAPAAATTYYASLPNTTSYAWATQRPQEIRETARSLENDPQRIFAFVRNTIAYEARFGAQKGALGALFDRSGTAFDQAQLLVELLRAAGFSSARYVVGNLTLTGAQFQAWLGISDPLVARDFLVNGGIPSQVTGSGSITSVTLGHAWVQVTVNGTTVTLDPSYKAMRRWSPIDVETAAAFSTSSFVSQATTALASGSESGVPFVTGVNIAGIESALNAGGSALLASLRASYAGVRPEQVYGGSQIIRMDDPWASPVTGTLSASLGTFNSGLPDKFRTTLTVTIGACTRTFFVDEIYGRRLAYQSSYVYEENVGSTAAWTTRQNHQTREGLALNGQVVQSGCLSASPRTTQMFRSVPVSIMANLPYAALSGTYMDRSSVKEVDTAGSDVLIVHGWGNSGRELEDRVSGDVQFLTETQRYEESAAAPPGAIAEEWTGPPYSDPGTVQGTVKAQIYASWLAQLSQSVLLIEGVSNVRIQHHYSIGVSYAQAHYTVNDANKDLVASPGETVLEYSPVDRALRLDVDSGFSTTSNLNSTPDELAARHTVAAVGAMLEGSVFEQATDAVYTASTAQRLAWAQQNFGSTMRFHTFTPATSTATVVERRRGVAQSSVFCQGARSLADGGFSVIVANDRFLGPGTEVSAVGEPYAGYALWGNSPGTGVVWRAPEADLTMHRGCAWVAFNADGSQISHVVTSVNRGLKGGGGPGDARFLTTANVSTRADLLQDGFQDRSSLQGVDLRTGALTYEPAPDLTVGSGEFPYSLSFQRTFRSNTPGCPGCGYGWTHNWDMRTAVNGSGLEGMGATHPLPLAAPLVAIHATFRLFRSGPTQAQNHLAAAVAMRWLSRHLTNNVATVTMGTASETYIRLVDGTFAAPLGSQSTLEQSGQRTILAEVPFVPPAKSNRRQPEYIYDNVEYVRRSGSGDVLTFRSRVWNPSGGDGPFIHARAYYTNRAQAFFANRWTFPEGVSLSFSYCEGEPFVAHNQEVGLNGNTAAACRDQISRISNSLGLYIDINVLDATTSDGRTVRADWDVAGQGTSFDLKGVTLRSFTDAAGGVWNYTWARMASGDRPSPYVRLVSVRSPGAATPSMAVAYDALGRVREVRDGVAAATGNQTRAYSFFTPGFEFGARRDPAGGFVRIRYDGDDRAVAQTDEIGRTWRAEYDNLGRLSARVLPLGDRFEFGYDARHNLVLQRRVSQTGTSGGVLTASYTYASTCTASTQPVCNRILSATDPNNNTTNYSYFPSGRLRQVLQPAVGGVRPASSFTYNAIGQITSATDPTGVITQYEYYPLNAASAARHTNSELMRQIINPGALALTTTQEYDAAGNVTRWNGPRADVQDIADFVWDANRRLQVVIEPDPDGTGPLPRTAVRTTYAGNGLPLTVARGTTTLANASNFVALETTSNVYDASDNLIRVTTPAGVTQFGYDALNRRTCQAVRMNPSVYAGLPADACVHAAVGQFGQDRISRSEYNAAGEVIREVRGVGTPEEQIYMSVSYTANGQRDWIEDANRNRTNYDYNGFDRLMQVQYPVTQVGGQTANASDFEQFGYDNNGNQTSWRRRNGQTINYQFDALNRQTVRDLPGGTAADVFSTFDLAGRRLSVRYGSLSGQGVVYAYDTAGRLTGEASYNRALTFGLDPAGNRTRLTWPDGNFATYSYDAANRPTTVLENGVQTGAGVLGVYGYDSLGRRTSLARGDGGGARTTYAYDGASRLITLSHDFAGTAHDQAFTFGYTPSSQVLSRATSNPAYDFIAPLSQVSYTSNGRNQYTAVGGVALAYDANANLTSDGARNFTYDLENRLTQVSGSQSAGLSYDPLGRLRETNGSAVTQFLYDGDRLVAEYNGAGVMLRRYVHGPGVDEPLVWYEGAGLTDRRWFHTDHQGTVIATSASSGQQTGTYAYGPYGEPANDNWTGARFRYTGQIALPEVRLYHYKARVYDPGLGRFLQTDPIGYEDDLNLYAYVRNDPVNATDPTGTCTGSRIINEDGTCRSSGGSTTESTGLLEGLASSQAKQAEVRSWDPSVAPAFHPVGSVTVEPVITGIGIPQTLSFDVANEFRMEFRAGAGDAVAEDREAGSQDSPRGSRAARGSGVVRWGTGRNAGVIVPPNPGRLTVQYSLRPFTDGQIERSSRSFEVRTRSTVTVQVSQPGRVTLRFVPTELSGQPVHVVVRSR